MNGKKGLYTVLLLVLALGVAREVRAVQAVVSATVFCMPDAGGSGWTPYVEVCWEIDPMTLHYRKDSAGMLRAEVRTDVEIYDDKGIVAEDHYLLHTRPSLPEAAAGQQILELKRLPVPGGKLRLVLRLMEQQFPETAFTHEAQISVPLPDSIRYSDIQLVDTLYPAPEGTLTEDVRIFLRNGYIQLPFPGNFLDDHRKIIRFYAELYRADGLEPFAYPLTQELNVSRREDGGTILHLQRTDTLQPAPVIPVNGQFDLSTLASGNYFLNVRLYDRDHRELTGQRFFFQLVNKNPVSREQKKEETADTTEPGVTFLDMSTTFTAKYTLPQIKAILEMLLPIAEEWDRRAIENFLKKPDEMYMRYFIYNYFQKINGKEPEKAWKEYADKVREVNRMFGSGTTPGYKTDRGYIYLRYGKPDDRVIVRNEPGALPYEIWQYYSTRRQSTEGIFLFYQPGASVQDFRLLHSTVNGELRNSQWRRSLYIKGDDNANLNSRAEQYIRNR